MSYLHVVVKAMQRIQFDCILAMQLYLSGPADDKNKPVQCMTGQGLADRHLCMAGGIHCSYASPQGHDQQVAPRAEPAG